MDAQSEKQANAQIYVLRRVKYLSSGRHFRAVGFKDISKQYLVAFDAVEEAEQFERFIESSAWLAKLTTVQESFLHTTNLESEIEINSSVGHSSTIFPLLLAQNKRYYLTQAAPKTQSLDADVEYHMIIACKLMQDWK